MCAEMATEKVRECGLERARFIMTVLLRAKEGQTGSRLRHG